MAKYKVEQVSGETGRTRRTAVVDESKVSETRETFRKSMRKHAGESSDWLKASKR